MPIAERYWLNAAVYALLGNATYESANAWYFSTVTMWVCYMLSAGYFAAMALSAFRRQK